MEYLGKALRLFVLGGAGNDRRGWHIACNYKFPMNLRLCLTLCLLTVKRAISHHKLMQGGRSSMDFVAFDHIRCCGQPHRVRLDEHGEQSQMKPYVTISIIEHHNSP